ncbi:expressed protein [Echinococcus multilocularis]|uniref:Expressed protein n=1 Tax=Echinococcus multilocularis TaxID=6211 RepID=A0A068YME2_ECHMU|nr:expressed protein [Echinococcus multilocularis]
MYRSFFRILTLFNCLSRSRFLSLPPSSAIVHSLVILLPLFYEPLFLIGITSVTCIRWIALLFYKYSCIYLYIFLAKGSKITFFPSLLLRLLSLFLIHPYATSAPK